MQETKTAVKFRTTAAYIRGAICGQLWMGGKAGTLQTFDVKPVIRRFSDPKGTTFEDIVRHLILENGGDFQNAQFTADTYLRIERTHVEKPGVYTVHVRERELGQLPGCADYVDAEAFTCDFMSDYD